MYRPTRPVLCAMMLVMLSLTGCRVFSGKSACDRPQTHGAAESIPQLKIPAGLDAPDTRGALRIPELNEPEAPRGPSDPCLDEPPQFTAPAPAR